MSPGAAPRALRAARRRIRRRAAAELRRRGWAPVAGGSTAAGAGQAASPGEPGVVGVVEEFSRVFCVGWVAVPSGAPPIRVTLHVGRTQVAATWAAEPSPLSIADGEIRGFRFKVRGLWNYVRRTHRITVRVDGRPLPVAGQGMFLRPERDGKHTVALLKARLGEGYVFSQTGSLQLSRKLDLAWQAEIMGLYAGVREVLAEDFGYDAFVIYGSLLGAVREGGFIGHDIDFDAAYLSRHTEPAAAGAELKAIALRLIERGFDVDCMRIALHVHARSDPKIRIDLFHLYFDSDGVLAFPFGVAGVTDVRKEQWLGTTLMPFESAEVLAPVNAEQVVEAIYGAGWREPNPGFSWARDRRKKANGAFVPPEGVVEVAAANLRAKTEAARTAGGPVAG